MLLDVKDRAETNAPLAKGESRGFSQPEEAAPPSYDQVGSSSSSAPSAAAAGSSSSSRPLPSTPAPDPSPLANAPHSSHVSTFSANGTIKASHVLDLNKPVPPAVLGEAQHEGEVDGRGRRMNGFWSSKNGSVRVDVGVQGRSGTVGELERAELDEAGKKGDERVRIDARSKNGGVRCSVLERSPLSTPFTANATSQNGTVHLVLPSSFRGPLALSTTNGKINLSARVKAAFTPLKDGQGFVGDMAGWDGTDDDAEARGWDVGSASSKNGSVSVKFAEEVEEEIARPGWFGGLFKSSR